jgi:hypothetical protein
VTARELARAEQELEQLRQDREQQLVRLGQERPRGIPAHKDSLCHEGIMPVQPGLALFVHACTGVVRQAVFFLWS